MGILFIRIILYFRVLVLGLPNIVGGIAAYELLWWSTNGEVFVQRDIAWGRLVGHSRPTTTDRSLTLQLNISQPIYQLGTLASDNYSEIASSRFRDVRTKTISVSRYLKAF